MNFTISLSGTKEAAAASLREQVSDDKAQGIIERIITNAPGSHVSLSGSMASSEDGKTGTISLNGSFWTEAAEKAQPGDNFTLREDRR